MSSFDANILPLLIQFEQWVMVNLGETLVAVANFRVMAQNQLQQLQSIVYCEVAYTIAKLVRSLRYEYH